MHKFSSNVPHTMRREILSSFSKSTGACMGNMYEPTTQIVKTGSTYILAIDLRGVRNLSEALDLQKKRDGIPFSPVAINILQKRGIIL